MNRGKQTNIAGLYRDGAAWVLRATARTKAGVKIEKSKRLETATPGEAMVALEQLRRQLTDEIEHGKPAKQAETETLSVYAQRWLQSLAIKRKGKIKPASIDTRMKFLERFVLPYASSMTPKQITPSVLESWKEWLAQQTQPARIGKRKNPRGGMPYAHETLLTAWATMRALLGWASIKAGVPNPIANLRFDVEGTPRRPKSALTRDELARLIKAAEHESPDIRCMLIVGIVSGMRFCELSALEWHDIDLVEGRLRIVRSQIKGQVGPPKTEASRREVYLPPGVVEALRRHLHWQREQDEDRGGQQGIANLVFPSRLGTYRFPNVLTKPLERCCALAGIPKRLTSHCMRVTASNLIRQAAGDAAARAMVGHARESADMTFRYSEVDRTERLAAQNAAFGRFLGTTFDVGGTGPTS